MTYRVSLEVTKTDFDLNESGSFLAKFNSKHRGLEPYSSNHTFRKNIKLSYFTSFFTCSCTFLKAYTGGSSKMNERLTVWNF